MTETTRLLHAFWHRSRKVHLPWCLPELAQRSGIPEDRTKKLLSLLTRQNLVFTEHVRGEVIYHLTSSGVSTLEWEIENGQKTAKGKSGISPSSDQRVSVGDKRKPPVRNMAKDQPEQRKAVA